MSMEPFTVKAFCTHAATSPLVPTDIKRRAPKPHDVRIDILFCGICHSDLHTARNEWGTAKYPCVPGHEIVGRVASIGADVDKCKAGDLVAVGCLVDSDRTCEQCRRGNEQYCPGMILTYGSADKHLGGFTHGGYSQAIVVDEHFVFSVPASLAGKLAGVAPLVCAGITTWSPLRRGGVGPGMTVAIAGLGGLGHMGVKFARAFGAHVTVLTSSAHKRDDALRLGAHEVVLMRDAEELRRRAASFDFILDTISAEHNLNAFVALLKIDGRIVLVGASPKPFAVSAFPLLFGRRTISGSLIGSCSETQEMLDFCGEHGITADVEVIQMQNVNEAYERMLKSDVKYRFSIDMTSLK